MIDVAIGEDLIHVFQRLSYYSTEHIANSEKNVELEAKVFVELVEVWEHERGFSQTLNFFPASEQGPYMSWIINFFMTIVGEDEYLKKNKFRLWKNGYLNMDKKFDGFIFYHNIYGVFVNGWYYQDGKLLKKATLSEEGGFIPRFKVDPADCITYYIYTADMDCTDWYRVGEDENGEETQTLVHSQCGDWDITVGTVTICDPSDHDGELLDPDDPEGIGGEGGYDVYVDMTYLNKIYAHSSSLSIEEKTELARALNKWLETDQLC